MKVGDKIKLIDAGEATVSGIHEDSGRLECTLPDGRTTVAWPDAVAGSSAATVADAAAAVKGKATVTVNGKAL